MVYTLLVEKCVFICTMLVIVKEDVQVDCGRSTDCLLEGVQFDYGRISHFYQVILEKWWKRNFLRSDLSQRDEGGITSLGIRNVKDTIPEMVR